MWCEAVLQRWKLLLILALKTNLFHDLLLSKERIMKHGTVREDGKIYWRSNKNQANWISQEDFKKRIQTKLAYQRKCRRMYREMHQGIIPKLWTFSSSKKLYFCGISSSGKEMWRDREYMLRKQEILRRSRVRNKEKIKLLPKTNLKIGDQHPDNPKLYVIRKNHNKVYFGNLKKLEEFCIKRRACQARKNKKYQQKRKMLVRKYKRGDVHPETKKVFWYYAKSCNEIWLDASEFKLRHERYNLKQRILNRKRKEKLLNKA